MAIRNVIFDLDGTISDSSEGIYETVSATLRHFGATPPSESVMRSYIGPPTEETYGRYFGEEVAKEASQYHRQIYTTGGSIFKNRMYDGMKELLTVLKSRGYMTFIATTKEVNASRRIADIFGISDLLDGVYGVNVPKKLMNKTDVLVDLIARHNLKKEECVMVGDTKYDYEGATNVGIPFGAAMYGFGTREYLLSLPAIFYAETPISIADYLK